MQIGQILLAFGEGVGLIASPCILPVLPFLLAASLTGGRARPYGIVLGFAAAFSAFVLGARALVSFFDIDPQILRTLSIVLLFAFGFVLFFDKLSERFSLWSQGAAQWGAKLQGKAQDGFGGGVLIGAFIGFVWTPCAGPILAAVLVQAIAQETTLQSVFITFSFALGAALPMLLVALFGRRALEKIGLRPGASAMIRRVVAIVMMLASLAMAFGWGTDLAVGAQSQPTAAKTQQTVAVAPPATPTSLKGGLAMPYSAPAFEGLSTWLNSPPLTMEALRGHVVLIDFWTYSCINCVRTLPYLTAWDKAYRDKGLVIVGIHAPEFAFERKTANVQAAIDKYGIAYPVALDNDLQTWRAYRNRYWPAHYLINKEGQVVYTHFGEGQYEETENNIRYLLGLNGEGASVSQTPVFFHAAQTPETYLGYARASGFVGEGGQKADQQARYVLPTELSPNTWGLGGDWKVEPERLVALSADSSLKLSFTARKVFLVMGPDEAGQGVVEVFLNGVPVTSRAAGADVGADGAVHLKGEGLYELLHQPAFEPGVLELHFKQPGLSAYAFTFGG